MESSNQENFFETDVQQEKRKQRALKQDNPFGNPIRLPSKVLAVLPDPTNPNALLTAESSGRVARISLTSRKPTTKFAGPAVPVTSLATSSTTLFAGAWDKTIWSWDLRTGAPQRRYAGHADFHETSVYKVLFDQESEEIDLWTASADGTAKCLARGKDFTTEDTFEHGDFVKGLVLTETWVVTGGFSQDIKVWDRTSGSLVYTISAHFDEITDLIVLRDPSGKKDTLVSISIDRTIRTWSLDKQGLDEAVEEIRKAGEPVEEDEQQAKKDGNKKEGLMTADEEAELAALMDSD
ncbi:hypothetical protein VdG2_02469 [Verticillium dahliae VDG2]|nr:hypothetical protein VdG2_02469 [Verticillium dahliae VDG2]